jgi:PAS domain S-box-containing protein
VTGRAPDERDAELAELRGSLGHLMSLLALSAAWAGREPQDLARTFAEALRSILSLDFVYVGLAGESGTALGERGAALPGTVLDPDLRRLFGDDHGSWPTFWRGGILGKEVSLTSLPLGLAPGFGIVAAATKRPDFPTDAERLVLNVARNQAVLALQSARLRREERLHASEASALGLIEGVPGLVAVLGPDGRVERVNRQIREYCGQDLEELRGWGTIGTVHPEDMPHAAKVFGASIASGTPYKIEQRLRRSDGEYRWFDNRGNPFRDDNGAVQGWHVLLSDIDELKRAEAALRSNERHLVQIVETIPQNLFGAGPDGLVNYLNPQLRQWFGRADETIMAEEWVNLVHPDDRNATVEAWMSTVVAGTPYRHQVRFIHRTGEYRWCEVRAQPLRDGAGRILAWHGVVEDIHDRRLAEDRLKASERSLQLIIDTIPALAWSANADGTADFFSQQYLDYVGQTREGLRDWQWAELIHPDDLETIMDTWEACRAAGTGAEVEARLRRHDGTYRWFLFQTSALRDADGTVRKWYGVNTDIEDRKRAEEDLAARERNLSEALDHLGQAQRLSHTGSFTTDVRADTHVWSEELYRILEYDRATTPTLRGFRARIHPEDLSVFDAAFARSMAGKTEFDQVFRIITPKGNTRYLHAAAHFLADADRPTVIGSIQDITESKRVEDELRRSAHYLAVGERISLTGSFAWDLETDRIVMSEQLRLLHELDPSAELSGADFRKRIHPDDVRIFEAKSAELAHGGDHVEYEFRLFTARGRLRHVRAFVQIIRQPDGRLERVGAVQDITGRRLAEEALDKVRSELAHVARTASLGELAASIAHEVNQPLAGIITNASTCQRLLAQQPPDIEGAIRTAQRTIRDGNRASEVTRRLRGLFRKRDFVAEPLDLNEAVQEVVAICAHDMLRRRLSLSVELEPGLQPVTGDRIQLQQVILNLILNAADAVEENAEGPRQIFVETRKAGPDNVELAIRDTGHGLPADAPGRVFEAFYTTKADGMGIGLSVSKSIVERHDGKLWAAPADSGGAVFAFSIPVRTPDSR